MATPDHVREPCPDRIVDDVGGAFAMGALGGSVYHAVAGARRSPRGHFRRLRGAGEAVAMNAPRIGGSFAVWGGLFSAFDCGFVQLRQKEDPWNSIAAGASTGGVLQLRQGPAVAARSAVLGGLLLGLIEGAAVLMNRLLAHPHAPAPHPVTVAAANSPHNTGARSDPDLDVFGSHSAAPPAMPSFDVE